MTTKKAVLLLSGGLDSTTTLAYAKDKGYSVHAISFSYGQRHNIELEYAKRIAITLGATEHKIASIDLSIFQGSALTSDIDVPKNQDVENNNEIPVTYVPARNTIFLSYALGYAESIGAYDIFIGANQVDYSGYPDCRPEFISAFEKTANLATAAAMSGNNKFSIHTPLINLTKAEIISMGHDFGIDYSMTLSCYDPNEDGSPCGQCDSCLLRKKGFNEHNMDDPACAFNSSEARQ